MLHYEEARSGVEHPLHLDLLLDPRTTIAPGVIAMWKASERKARRELSTGQIVDQRLKAQDVYGVFRAEFGLEIGRDSPGCVTREALAVNGPIPQDITSVDQGLLRDGEERKVRQRSYDACPYP